MDPREFGAMVRASRWSALTPSLPFSGLDEDRPPVAAPLYGAIHPEAYQPVAVLRALEMPRVALMLADAVGLGKKIQAGMVLRELILRRRIRRVLVLCPASLRTQWRDEMQEKFARRPDPLLDRGWTSTTSWRLTDWKARGLSVEHRVGRSGLPPGGATGCGLGGRSERNERP